MNKIHTAEQFFEQWCKNKGYISIDEADDIKECLIEFTKLHVEAALKTAAEKAETYLETYSSPYSSEWTRLIDKKSILNAYPLENIK